MIHFNNILQDGKLDSTVGRIVIFNEFIEISRGPSRDHNDLLRSLASKFRLNKDEVISKAIRLYWCSYNRDYIVSPVRKLDKNLFENHEDFYLSLIMKNIT